MSVRTFAVFLLVLAAVGVLGFGLVKKSDEAIAVGDAAPQPGLTELGSGAPASLEEYRGRWTLVNFWSSWCEPCRSESPDLQAFADAHPEVAVVGVNLEDASEDARAFVSEFKLTYPQLRATDSSSAREDYGMVARPENFLIDPEGKVAYIQRGPVDEKILRERIEPLTAGSAQ
ncbi:MAG TPA: TlpA disulfide reductase family protein [Solirubrobacterales bacterium]|jgi:thiol-disulfide isomerase/thioredoxin|nr:TlpA disulfide reductase family protein [Solirubrobacterales bacterium]